MIYLNNIKDRFKLDSILHTKVFWSWAKYVLSEVIRGGNLGNERLGIGNSFTDGFYNGFAYLQDHLQLFLLKEMFKVTLKN